jgi:prevent-host-death family protein
MKTPESVPVEEARRKFADILDGTQHHSQHWQITRRGKPAGYVVPPEWWTASTEQAAVITELRKEIAALRKAAPTAPATKED